MVDTFKTRDQLIQRALKNLAIIEPGEAPSPEDYETVNDLVDPLLAQLATDQIIYIQDPEQIDLNVYMPLARLLANVAGPDFGSAINEGAKQADESLLKRLNARLPSYEVVRGHYF
jgi:hypothetical protein